MLTHGQQNLSREVTTPSLPPFITACLNLITIRVPSHDAKRIDVYAPLLNTVLQAFIRLLPQHPTAFRPFIAQIKSVISPLLAPTPLSVSTKESHLKGVESPSRASVALSQRLLALLPYSAPRNTSGDEWTKSLHTVLAQAHRTANHVFRAVVEEWTPPSGSSYGSVDSRTFGQVVSDIPNEQLGLPGWRGIHGGIERLVGLVELIQAYIATTSDSSVTIPLSLVGSLIERLMSVIGPSKSKPNASNGYDVQPRVNPEIGREEREGLWNSLPSIHVVAIDLLSLLILRLQGNSVSFAQGSIDLALWVFRSSAFDAKVRKSTYKLMSQIFALVGPSMSQSTISSLSPLIRACCEDILPSNESSKEYSYGRSGKAQNNNNSMDNVDSYLGSDSSSITSMVQKDVYDTALAFLSLLLSKLPAEHLSRPARSQLDRTAILIGDKNAMVASVLNPAISQDNDKKQGARVILPYLARAHADAFEVEAILRPRLPVIKSGRDDNRDPKMNEDDYSIAREALGNNVNEYRRNEDLLYNNAGIPQDHASRTPSVPLPNAIDTTMPENGHLETQDSEMHNAAMPITLDQNKRPRKLNDSSLTRDPSASVAPTTHLNETSTPPTKRVKLDDKTFVVPTESITAPQKDSSKAALEQDQTVSPNTTNLTTSGTGSASVMATSAVRLEKSDNSDSGDSSEIPTFDPTLNSDLFEDDEYEDNETEPAS